MINLLIISGILCYIVDISGIVDEFKKWLWKKYIKKGDYHNLSLKPFDCSRCGVWWTGLIYIIVSHQFTLPMVGFVALLSLLASNISDFLIWIKDTLTWVINKIYWF